MTDANPSEDWLLKAEADLAFARTLLGDEDLPTWGACFHAQQAAEKAIKALLVVIDIDPPKAHNLVTLAGLLPDSSILEATSDELAGLTRWAVTGRYPEPAPDPSRDLAEETVELAARIVRTARAAK